MARTGTIRIGISGWTYARWHGVFYPEGLPQRQELAYAAEQFPSIEVNGTFYGLQRPESFARWSKATPDDFVFAIKGSRYITHLRRLRDVETPLANFLASGLLRLGPKLGPILWKFPPSLKFDPELFDAFLALLPHDTDEASALARRHDARLEGRAFTESDATRPLRHAVEIRHDSFRSPEFIALLRRHKVGLVVADTVEWPLLMDLTAYFVYCRLHGSEELYASGYDGRSLDRWAGRIRAWAEGREPEDVERVMAPTRPLAKGRDVYVYFDNDMKVRAPADALSLMKRLSVTWRQAA
ncbi:hypothetical protein GCM10011491_04250 [Brucella endophytica]|uniref:DUF72 domain-containing protein n=1 Tax=Brucella endophytica TaxID=1963359 RepID=A0A916WAG0_9HYPH|nr:DUF72 domain-containing protein [Brucella endophytica]GGA80109.1 hypothetical protein GCM10011491_04250 [Brucella endophytica]